MGIVSLFWDAVDEGVDIASYRVRRNTSVIVYSGIDTYVEDNTVVSGETYAYTVEHVRLDGSVTIASKPSVVQVLDRLAGTSNAGSIQSFFCDGASAPRGMIRLLKYSNGFSRSWTLQPPSPSSIVLRFLSFSLECNHDFVHIEATKNGTTETVWHGGCQRPGELEIITHGGIDAIRIAFRSDASIAYDGFELEYEMDSATEDDVPETSIDAPCPVHPDTVSVCSGNGACRAGGCVCFGGFVGEDCGNPVICPSNRAQCQNASAALACDSICYQDPATVLVVSVTGDDVRGTGAMMDTSQETGTSPKALRSLSRALALAQSGYTILLYPGTHRGSKNCQQTVSGRSVTIRGIRGSDVTTLDCQHLDRGITITGVEAQLIGFRIVNSVAPRGAGVTVVDSARLVLSDVILTKNKATVGSGGGLAALRSTVLLVDSTVKANEAIKSGGGMLLEDSSIIFNRSSVSKNSAGTDGGGVCARATVSMSISAEASVIESNTALQGRGGGIFATGLPITMTSLQVRSNTANVGGGVAIETGDVTFQSSEISENTALSDGGGLALLSQAKLTSRGIILDSNTAVRNGGGVYLITNVAATFDSSTRVTNGVART
ncbi:hypothetical protein PINS_up000060 [Pythium insidiosum]|nr:hypothetical protein PINS_up000060 [Pythium insidiosum]